MKSLRSTQDTLSAFSKVARHTHRCVGRWGTLLISFSSLCFAGKSLANPFGEKLKLGSAEFIRDGSNLFIRQGSDMLVVDWKDFSIGAGELTQFLQPGGDSAALNRVYGGNPSSIYGSLRANGKVYLINPNGVFIGPSGRVDAGSFIASTLDTSDEEFLKRSNLTFKGESDASVVNLGTITALDGDAFLIARTVENHGTINAPKGTVGLAGGTEVILQPAGDEKIGVSIASGSGKVVNTGKIASAQAELKAAGGNLYALAIKNTGTIRATGVERRGGRVFLRASGGRIENSGTVRAKNVNGTGGRIVFGPAKDRKRFAAAKTGVRVVNTGVVDASGTSGGSVKITADEISLSESSQLLASGTEGLGGSIQIEADDIVVASTANLVGDGFSGGGSIIAVADNAMEFSGTISARATADYADGGFAEISGLNSLKFTGTADLRSTSGRTGSLLLDPVNSTIDATAAGTIVSNLSTSNVIISTAGAGTAAGDIFVNAPVLYNSANTLSLLAHRNIRANASIQNSGAGAINLIAGWDGVTGLGPQGVDFAAFSNAPSTYGNNNGSVFIGSDLTENAVAVGTRFGATNAAGFSMAVTGSDKRNTAFAQFGFTASSGNISGPIHVVLKDDLALTGGKFNFAHAQIGHGGPSSSANIQGAISVRVGGELRILGDVNFSYAQIGHGGEGSRGTQSGSISVHANTLNLTGGSLPHANAQIGHGDGSGDASGLRSGAIEVEVSGETTLMNGPGNNAIWLIGHGTKTPSGVSNADVTFSTSALDHSLSSVATLTTLSQDFADKFTRNLLGGDVTVRASGSSGLVVNGGFAYNSPHNLALIADANATINGSLINGGLGEISLVIDNANAIRPNQNPAASLTIAPAAVIQSQGAIRIFAVTPANTHLGNFNPAQRRYGVWYGDATTVSGVNFKFQPTLTLTANNRTKTYGRTITFTGLEFSATGLQPGDTLAQVLAGVPVISSPGSIPTAGVTASPYPIVFDPALTTNFGYALQLVGGTLSVTPAPLQLTALNQSKIYGSSFVFTGREFSAVGLQNGENVGLVDLASPGAIATAGVLGSPYAITLANARAGTFDPANYEISYVPGTLSVTPAALTITAANRSKVYGGLLSFAGTEFTSAGLLNSDTISSVSLTSAGAINTAGVLDSPYTINVGNAIGTGLANYSITYIPGALTVTAAPLTVTALNRSKVYGDAVIFNGTEFSAAGLQNGEQIALADLASVGAPAIAGVAGSPYSITITNPRGSTFNPTNYAISYIPGALTVTPAPLTIAASNQSKVYGTSLTLNGTEFTSAGLRNSDTITGTIQASPGTSATAGVGGSPYTINIGSAVGTGLQNYAITYIPGALSVTPAPLTLTALNQTKVYGNTFTFVGTEFAATGLKNGESVGTVDLASPGSAATAGVTGSPYTIAITNPRGGTFDAANYAISYVPGSLTVTPAPLTITASNQSKIYGTSFTFNGTEFTSAGLRNADGITSASLSSPGAAATATIGGSPYKISIASAIGTGLENYNITYVPGALTVTQAGLIITATNQTKVYGTLFGFNGTEFASTGLRDGDSIAAVALSSLGAAATAGVAGSPYTINIGDAVGIGLQNYTITYVPGALSVTPAPLTLTALNQTKVYGNTFTFVGTEFAATGLKNGESVGTVDLVSPGSAATAGVTGSPYSIAITNPRGGTFDPANYAVSYVPGSLTITPAALTITASNQSKVYGASFNFGGTEFTSVGLVNGDAISNVNLTSSGAVPTAGVAGSPYTINVGNALGTGLQNYTISYVPGALTVTPAPLTLTARDQTKIYGTTFVFAGTEFTAAGLQNGEGISLVELASAGAPGAAGVAGSPYVITISNPHGGSFDPANYAISYTPGALTVTPATLTITAANQSKVYGSLFSFNGTEFTSAGLVNGDTISSANLTSIGAVPTAGVAGGPYPITIGNGLGVGLENYTISYIPGALAVTPAPLTLTAQNQTKVYGATLSFTGAEFSATGLQNGESIGQVDLASIGAAPTAGVAGGPYAIAISNPRDGTFDPANYAISFVDGTLVITPAALTIKPINQRKRVGNDLIFSGTEFIVSGLQNGETVGLVSLSSAGAPGTAVVGEYSILASNAREGTFDPTNYIVSYQEGTLDVVPKPTPPPPPLPPPPPPVVGGPSLEDLLVLLNQLEQSNQSTPQSAVDPAQDGPSIISGFGIQRLNLNSFFGEQLLEPGGALMIDATGIGPPLPIGEAPQDLENQLAENPHEALEEAIAEDDKKAPNISTTRYYDVPAGQVFKANAPGEAGLQDLSSGPAILLQATDASIERQLLPAATR